VALVDLQKGFGEDAVHEELVASSDGEEVHHEPADFYFEPGPTVEFIEADHGIVGIGGRVPSPVDQDHRLILPWVVRVYVDGAVNVRKLNVCIGLDLHALRRQDLNEGHHVVLVKVFQGVLVNKVRVGHKHESRLAHSHSVVVDSSRRRHDLIEQVNLFLVVYVEDDEGPEALDEHNFRVGLIGDNSDGSEIVDL
jgi:hypothetical protein